MKKGLLYDPADTELTSQQSRYIAVINEYNATGAEETQKRAELLRRIFASVGEGCWFEPPLHANWGIHTHVGNNVYANFNLVLVDDGEVFIGDDVMIAPNVTIATAGHPVDPELRRRHLQFNLPVRIGRNVWIGADATILPGVTIGDDSVIGASSVVTRDVPSGCVAVGNPCRVMRMAGEYDREFYYRGMKVDL